MFNKNINFSTELLFRVSLKKQQFITWYSSLQYILLKMTISSPLKWEISTAEVTLLEPKFFSVRDPFWRQVRQVPQNIIYLRLSYENEISQAQNSRFVFKETPVYKRGVHRSAHSRYKYG